jgi:curli biogenesis system outer membrane secretion channel CsgG
LKKKIINFRTIFKLRELRVKIIITMKNLLLALFIVWPTLAVLAQKTTAEKVETNCNTPYAERPIVAVANFYNEAPNRSSNIGGGLSDMLTNALVESNCFRVVERKRINELMAEQSLGQSGAVDEASAASIGKLTGAQVTIIGVVTEFTENEAGGITGLGVRGVGVVGVGMNQAHVGLTIRLINSNTGEIIASKSVERKVRKLGMGSGTIIRGVPIGGLGFKSKAMADAAEETIIEAVEMICQNMAAIKAIALPEEKKMELPAKDACTLLKQPIKPKIMVIVPEVHIARRVPDPAGETEIIKLLIEYGFDVVDPTVISAIRDQERVNMARTDAGKAAQLGAEFNADIVIIGEAFSESTGARNGMQSCRARLEARAVQTSNGKILATNGMYASGLDNAELIAGKVALGNAGRNMGIYMITQFCGMESLGAGGERVVTSEILLTNINFSQLNTVYKYLQGKKNVKNVSKVLNGPSARITVLHSGSIDDLANDLDGNKSGVIINITGLSGSKIDAVVK